VATVFGLIALVPVLRRLRHPTLLGDDVIRVIDLIEHPLRYLLFRPFSEHVAPLFELVSWMTWQAVGHDIRLAALGYCVASIAAWVAVLGLLSAWLLRETRSRTATLVAVALAAQSPLVLETMWWYSAASFSYAVVGVLAALLGASLLATRPRRALVLIFAGSALGSAATSIGVLATPLAALRAALDPVTPGRRKCLGVLAAAAGLAVYLLVGALAGMSLLQSARANKGSMAERLAGLGYAFTVPGRVLWPSILGVPPSWVARPMAGVAPWLMGLAALTGFLALYVSRRVAWSRPLVMVGGSIIYLSYTLTYCSRAGLIRAGHWNEFQLLYQFAGRHHVLPLLGAYSLIAAMLGACPTVRRFDATKGKPLAVGILSGLVALRAYRPGVHDWLWMLGQPDQKATISALHRVGEVAREEGVTREQLTRIFDPVNRPWNSCLRLTPPYFHYMKMLERPPTSVPVHLSDEEARGRILARLSERERLVLMAGAVYTLSEPSPTPGADEFLTVRLVTAENAREIEPGRYCTVGWPSYLECEAEIPTGARFLSIPGLSAKDVVKISWSDDHGHWRFLQHVFWVSRPAPNARAAIDLHRLVNWPTRDHARFRVEFTTKGEIALRQPRLLR
jgi:hypothetical protein